MDAARVGPTHAGPPAPQIAGLTGDRIPDPVEGLWVVVPAFEEVGIIGTVVAELRQAYENVVVVDDGSRDATAEQSRRQGAEVVRHPVNLGQGAAIQTGIEYALSRGADLIATFDADGQHSPADIRMLLDAQRGAGSDVVLGSRFLGAAPEMPPLRRLLLRMAVAFTRTVQGMPVTDTHNGLRLFTRRAARHIRITQNRMAHASQILAQVRDHRLTFVEAPVTVRYTPYSLRKGQRTGDALHVLADLLVGRFLR